MHGMTTQDYRQLAERGALERLRELRREAQAVEAVIRQLRGGPPEEPSEPPRTRRKMSAAQRKAVSTRMKAYWAQQRARG